jgi:hypothetical protein
MSVPRCKRCGCLIEGKKRPKKMKANTPKTTCRQCLGKAMYEVFGSSPIRPSLVIASATESNRARH